ncbi:MAG TPA: MFS transporter [Stellaceae bacterium]|nr:MFS transporter [Stellaceae bacterium]
MAELAAAGNPPIFTAGYRRWLLGLLLIVWSFNFVDRFVLATQAQAIKLEFGLSDFQLGLLQGLGFALLYAVLGLPVARLAEHRSRVAIIGVAVLVWTVAVASCGLVGSFWLLFVLRVGVGAGDAGFMTPVGSLIADHFAPKERGSAFSIINLAAPVGSAIGAVGGGWIAQDYGWRTAFIVAGLPGVILALLVFGTLREPPRAHAEGGLRQGERPPPVLDVFRLLFAKPTFRHLLVGVGLSALGMNAIGQFLPAFIVRSYHMGLRDAGVLFATVSFFSLGIGILLGGYGGDRLVGRDARWQAWLASVGVLLAGPLYIAAFLQPSPIGATCFLLFAAIALFLYVAPSQAMVQNMTPPLARASASYIFAFLLAAIGAGFGPTLVGLCSDYFARTSFTAGDFHGLCPAAAGASPDLAAACADASAIGLRDALIVSAALFVWASLHFYLAARTVRQDVRQIAPA